MLSAKVTEVTARLPRQRVRGRFVSFIRACDGVVQGHVCLTADHPVLNSPLFCLATFARDPIFTVRHRMLMMICRLQREPPSAPQNADGTPITDLRSTIGDTFAPLNLSVALAVFVTPSLHLNLNSAPSILSSPLPCFTPPTPPPVEIDGSAWVLSLAPSYLLLALLPVYAFSEILVFDFLLSFCVGFVAWR